MITTKQKRQSEWIVDESEHLIVLVLDRADALELVAAAVQVMPRSPGLEVHVAPQIIRQEPDADLQRDQLATETDNGGTS